MSIPVDPTTVIGTAFDDRLIGTSDDQLLFGVGGNDKIYGREGRDRLIGGEGDDLLRGDRIGMAYADVFVFGKNSGNDIVADFDVDLDILEIARGLNDMRRPSHVLDYAEQVGRHVVIDLGDGNSVTLKHVRLDDLTFDNFDVA